jgi:hypothetical protein
MIFAYFCCSVFVRFSAKAVQKQHETNLKKRSQKLFTKQLRKKTKQKSLRS